MKHFILLLLIFIASIKHYANNNETILKDEIMSVIKDKKATIGVAIIYDGKDTLTINNKYRYPTVSVYKFYQALAIMNYLDINDISLDSTILIKKEDFLSETYSPLRDKYIEGNLELPISELLKYSVSKSDNNACDILFNFVGGTKNVDKYIKEIGVKETQISATEAEMNLDIENQYLNWTTPLSAVYSLDKFLRTDLFDKQYRNFLVNILIETSTGEDKIKGLLPKETIVGHKTGSSSRNEFGIKIADNDLGFILLPNQKIYTIAIFVMNSTESDVENANIIAQISKIVYDYYLQQE